MREPWFRDEGITELANKTLDAKLRSCAKVFWFFLKDLQYIKTKNEIWEKIKRLNRALLRHSMCTTLICVMQERAEKVRVACG